jgi:hypothetical protein
MAEMAAVEAVAARAAIWGDGASLSTRNITVATEVAGQAVQVLVVEHPIRRPVLGDRVETAAPEEVVAVEREETVARRLVSPLLETPP